MARNPIGSTQGSVLGPLFNIDICDLFFIIEDCDTTMQMAKPHI